ncbi:MAG: PAS domain S-box protein, partial [Ginsengibacter sp.]
MPTNEISGLENLNDQSSQPVSFSGQGFHIATALIENMPDAVIVTDVNYLITGWNKGAEDMYNYTNEEVLGRKARDIIQTQFSSDKERTQWQQELNKTNKWQGEVIQKKRNGEKVYVLASIASIKDESGRIIGAVAVNRDITERKKIEEDLKNAKDVLELTVRNVPAAIYLFDNTGKIIFVNEKAAISMGFSSAQEALKEKDHLTLKNKVAGLFELLNDKNEPIDFSQTPGSITIRTGKASELVHQSLNKKTGQIMWVLSKAEPLLDENGNLKMVLGSSIDITLQKTAEEKIKESGQRFSAAIEAVQGILWTNNARGEMEGEQKGWAALTGQNYEEYQGYGWATAVHPEDALSSVEAWNEAVHECKTFVFEHRIKTKDGNWGLFSIRAIPLLNKDGSIREWVGVHTNITEQRKANEMIRENAERFRTLANSISQL